MKVEKNVFEKSRDGKEVGGACLEERAGKEEERRTTEGHDPLCATSIQYGRVQNAANNAEKDETMSPLYMR